MKLTKISEISGKDHTLDLPISQQEYIDGMNEFNKGVHIQDAFPELNADEREFILTGITSEEWEDTFGDEENDENITFKDNNIYPAF